MSEKEELVQDIQEILRQSGVDAWLFYDFRGSDPISNRILDLDEKAHNTRRWFYLVPATGTPEKLVHRIEPASLDSLPGKKRVYLRWEELQRELTAMLKPFEKVAMQYSSNNAIPYISKADAGSVELVRSCGPEVISSGDLIQCFEAVWEPSQVKQHRRAAEALTSIVQKAFSRAARQISRYGKVSEIYIQSFILRRFEDEHLVTDFPPIVAVNQNSADPHYQPTHARHSQVGAGDLLLIDLWAKDERRHSVFADITWTACFAEKAPARIEEVFQVVRQARDRGVEFLEKRFREEEPVSGWEVDDAVRQVIDEAGFAESFVHRTGHNLGEQVHGNGVNFDNLETHDTRRVIPGIGCTIEPGIYLDDFGIRSEINVYLTEDGPEVTTGVQDQLLLLPI